MSATQTFSIGVASGLAVAFLIFVFRHIIARVLSLVAGLFTRKLRGTWGTKFWKGSETFEEIAKVQQVFHKVWGTIEYPKKGRRYKFRGTLRSNVLVATYEIAGRDKGSTIDRGSFTLSVNPTGKVREMKGCYSWTDDDSTEPKGDKYEWQKKD